MPTTPPPTGARKDTPLPRTGSDERAVLVGFLDHLRAAVAAKAEDVPEPEVRTPGVPSGTTLLGLVKHLTAVERFWLLGEDLTDWEATLYPDPDETVDGLLSAYRSAAAEADAAISTWDDLTLPGPRPVRQGTAPSRRWTLVHMIEETGRHAGHADIVREGLDGAIGR